MTPKSTTPEPKVSRTWDHLEDFVRDQQQQLSAMLRGFDQYYALPTLWAQTLGSSG